MCLWCLAPTQTEFLFILQNFRVKAKMCICGLVFVIFSQYLAKFLPYIQERFSEDLPFRKGLLMAPTLQTCHYLWYSDSIETNHVYNSKTVSLHFDQEICIWEGLLGWEIMCRRCCVIYNKYIFGLCLVPISGTEFLRSLEFLVLRVINVLFVMLMK